MNRYIIKNCPAAMVVRSAINQQAKEYCCQRHKQPCERRTNCLLKQIIEQCEPLDGITSYDLGENNAKRKIMSLFEIQEAK